MTTTMLYVMECMYERGREGKREIVICTVYRFQKFAFAMQLFLVSSYIRFIIRPFLCFKQLILVL